MQNFKVELMWATPNGQELISEMARVSNPKNAKNTETAPRLIKYLIDHAHWSPFEMVNACFSIKTSRAVSRQILRHRSCHYQEISQRYANVNVLEDFELGFIDARTQDTKNRQNSLPPSPENENWWETAQKTILNESQTLYEEALEKGIAKEVARALLPEGLTPTHMYMNGTLRSWIHFCNVRCDPSTQLETRQIALAIKDILRGYFPDVFKALSEE